MVPRAARTKQTQCCRMVGARADGFYTIVTVRTAVTVKIDNANEFAFMDHTPFDNLNDTLLLWLPTVRDVLVRMSAATQPKMRTNALKRQYKRIPFEHFPLVKLLKPIQKRKYLVKIIPYVLINITIIFNNLLYIYKWRL